MDPMKYAQKLRQISHPEMKTSKNGAFCSPPLLQLYMSLLGAVAYLARTRVDALVFISDVQRHIAKPQIVHVKRLNKLLFLVADTPEEADLPQIQRQQKEFS